MESGEKDSVRLARLDSQADGAGRTSDPYWEIVAEIIHASTLHEILSGAQSGNKGANAIIRAFQFPSLDIFRKSDVGVKTKKSRTIVNHKLRI